LILCSAVLAMTASGQYRAGIQGIVSDPQGAPVPGASVVLTSKETNVARTTRTGETGAYSISGLAPGAYTLAVEKTGFARKVFEAVVVNAEQVQSLNVALVVGQVSESITVSEAAVPLLDTQGATIGGTITRRDVENLPSFGRDPFQLIRLTPGVFGNGAQSSSGGTTQMPGVNRPSAGALSSIFFIENGPQVIANGTRQNSNNIQLDGVGINSVSWGGSSVLTPNQESIKEVKVVANGYSAEDGRNSGAQIMVISQNGTNEYHGSAFFKWHRPGLNAFQRWNGPGNPSPVRRDMGRFNQAGGSLGGPVLKNKLFGFFSYEELRSGSKNAGLAWFETPEYRQNAGPSNSVARRMLSYPGQSPLTDGVNTLTCAQVGLAATQCRDTANGLDLGSPLNTPLGTADPAFGQPGTPYGIGRGFDGVPDVIRVQTLTPSSSMNAQYNARLDYNPTGRDMVALSVYWVPTIAYSINGGARTVNQWTSDRLSRSYTGIWNRTFSPTVLNEARFGFSGWKFDETESNTQQPWGLPPSLIDASGAVSYQRLGSPGPGVFDQGTWNVRDTMSKTEGRHFLKFGGDFSRAHFLDKNPGAARPTFRFRNLWSYANDAPYQESGNFDPLSGRPSDNQKWLRYTIASLFFQDDWKLRPNLTLNLGLRWEYYSPIKADDDLLSTPVLGAGPAALTGLTIRRGGGLTATRKANFGPQLGFSYNPAMLGSRLVLRGGFGIGYNVQQLATMSNGRNNPPWITSLTLSGSSMVYQAPGDARQFSGWPVHLAAIQSFDSTTGLPVGGAAINLVGFPDFLDSPRTYRYSLDAQYSIGRGWVATVGYQGSQSRNYQRQRNLNLIYYPALNPRVQRLNWYSNDASAHYNALLTQVQRRFSSQFTVDVQYRLSRNIDQGSQDFFSDHYPFDINLSNGPADFDVTHDFKTWGVWTPRLFKGRNNWLEKVAGGWSLSGILNTNSGFPWTPQYCNTGGNLVYANSGYGCLRPGSYAGGAGANFSNATFQAPHGYFPNGALNYFTLPTFAPTGVPPAPGVGRNVFRGPRYFGFDATLAKSFGLPAMRWLGEGARLNLQAHVYNAFNKLNLTGINTTISNDGRTSNPLFGQAQSAFAGRIVELQARFSF
jgi:hypothetical protein